MSRNDERQGKGAFDETPWLAYFEDDGHATGSAIECQMRRRMLYWAMRGAGFSPYPWEYWHYELGTLVAAVYYGVPVAEHGAAVPSPTRRR